MGAAFVCAGNTPGFKCCGAFHGQEASETPGVTLCLGSMRLNIGAFFSMSGMIMNLRRCSARHALVCQPCGAN